MTLLSLHGLGKWQGSKKLFENITFGLDSGSKLALTGPNGAGKTTLLNIIAGKLEADEGSISKSKTCKIAFLEQSPTFDLDKSILETVLEKAILTKDEFVCEQQAYKLISNLGFDDAGIGSDQKIGELSGGWQKKVALAREILTEPNLLLMDEPTNHLDVESILWLENYLNKINFATLIITHDRSFLQNTSTVIVELNRCYSSGFLKCNGDYADFCEIKANLISAQQQSERATTQQLKKEMEWMRKSPKARSKKQTARIKQTEELQEVVKKMSYRSFVAPVKIDFQNHQQSPKKLIEAQNISKSFGDKVIFSDFDLMVQKKSRIAFIGANGSGKSTLINCLLNKESINSGKLECSDLMKLSYFKQSKTLDKLDSKLIDFFAPDGGNVNYCGKWSSSFSYLARFGFGAEQHNTQVKKLSGGEKSRLLIAKLMLEESNLLVLDEPTNDLDLSTLNVLEEQLNAYQGALILVSHDRYFLDQVCNEIYAFSPNQNNKNLTRFADVHQWEKWHKEELKNLNTKVKNPKKLSAKTPKPIQQKKLSNKERLELRTLEASLPKKEKELESLSEKMQNCADLDKKEVIELSSELSRLQKEIAELYERWSQLSENT